ncbi:hypothetical protein J3F83DRAFT_723417 [Trichoderma novae-zelandiae]
MTSSHHLHIASKPNQTIILSLPPRPPPSSSLTESAHSSPNHNHLQTNQNQNSPLLFASGTALPAAWPRRIPRLTMAPALTISTTTTMASRSSSPVPPPMSPITPTLPPAQLSGDTIGTAAVEPLPPATTAQQQQHSQSSTRPTFAHSQQPDQVGVPPPPPRPIEFDTNPDVIALRSAITVLQIQKNRATADIQTLSQIKNAAIEHPDEFVRDLVQGRVGQGAQRSSASASASAGANDTDDREPAWIAHSIPKAQDVVRCPPINWSQYAVVGESLDKLHNEQVSRPTQGTPATLGAGGMYQFKGGDGKQEEYPGVAAPYAPLKDKIEKKTKSRK